MDQSNIKLAIEALRKKSNTRDNLMKIEDIRGICSTINLLLLCENADEHIPSALTLLNWLDTELDGWEMCLKSEMKPKTERPSLN